MPAIAKYKFPERMGFQLVLNATFEVFNLWQLQKNIFHWGSRKVYYG